ncbi:hypothetical protein DEO23_04590 [Brachybacterium endophyticum]|uniref:Acetyl xylan esterase domain-containing protein n=1 Tax=Brachybacterium endophyticum TaxID=2182385 RepID=A0A2U2RK68_9MICO|nr:acetylxylan esterase [Brachybacterium endophyticum]PWH06268.1 hypothetical protein DEO23_04590 [Brachybacterium endophyticum]
MSTSEERRQRLRDLLGLDRFDAPFAAPLSAPRAEEGTAPSDAAAACGAPQEVIVPGAHGAEIPAFLLRPEPGRATGAGAVLVAGHGRGIDDLVRTDPADGSHGGPARALVQAGVTVLCPEMVSFGRRRTPRPGGAPPYEAAESSCRIDAARYLLHGTPVMGHRTADAGAAVAALRRLDGVDPDRVAVVGASGGGAVALLRAAVDTSISAALVANYFSSFAASIAAIPHCPCNIVPGLLPEFEMADIGALVSPRTLILEAGERDPIFPVAATRQSFARLRTMWDPAPVRAPQLVVTGAGHRFVGEESVALLAAALG